MPKACAASHCFSCGTCPGKQWFVPACVCFTADPIVKRSVKCYCPFCAGFRDEPEDGHWQRRKASSFDWRGTEQGRTAAPGVASLAVSPDAACSSWPPPDAWSTSGGVTSDRRPASDTAQRLSESEPSLVTDQASARSPSMPVNDDGPSSSAEAGVDQRPAPDGSIAEGSTERTAVGRADERQRAERVNSFSKSSRLKQPSAAEDHAPVGLPLVGNSGGSMSAAAVSSVAVAGAVGTQPAAAQPLAAPAEAALSGSDLQATTAARASEAVETELLSLGAAASSSAGMPAVKKDAQSLLRRDASVQLAAHLLDVEQHAAPKQQSNELQQPTAKQKKHLEGQQQPVAEDTSEMRSQFVKQLLLSAFDMDQQW